MPTLREFAQEQVKEATSRSLASRFASAVSSMASDAIASGRKAVKKAKPTAKEQDETIRKFWDSLAGKALKASGAAAAGAGRIAHRAFTRDVGGGKRKLDVVKGALISAPPLAMYSGMKKGKMKAKQQRLYGQRKSPEIYMDPRRRLR